MNKLAIYISTFDGYSDLWDSFFKVFDINFNDCPYPIYMSTNYKDFEYKNLTIIKTGEEISWMNRIKKSMIEVQEEYVLFMLEDYLIGKKVNIKDIENIIQFMSENNVSYYRLQDTPVSESTYKDIKYLGKIKSKQKYGINTICSIWHKDFLLDVIEGAKGVESAWDFEVYLCNRFNSSNEEYIPNCCVDRRDILGIKNGVFRGKWFRSTIIYFRKRGIVLNKANREIMSRYSQFHFDLKFFVQNHISVKQKESLKKALRFVGVKFLSDKEIGGLK